MTLGRHKEENPWGRCPKGCLGFVPYFFEGFQDLGGYGLNGSGDTDTRGVFMSPAPKLGGDGSHIDLVPGTKSYGTVFRAFLTDYHNGFHPFDGLQ